MNIREQTTRLSSQVISYSKEAMELAVLLSWFERHRTLKIIIVGFFTWSGLLGLSRVVDFLHERNLTEIDKLIPFLHEILH